MRMTKGTSQRLARNRSIYDCQHNFRPSSLRHCPFLYQEGLRTGIILLDCCSASRYAAYGRRRLGYCTSRQGSCLFAPVAALSCFPAQIPAHEGVWVAGGNRLMFPTSSARSLSAGSRLTPRIACRARQASGRVTVNHRHGMVASCAGIR
jgi:hypothetical protein